MTPLIIPKNLGRKVVPLLRKTPDTCDVKVKIPPCESGNIEWKDVGLRTDITHCDGISENRRITC